MADNPEESVEQSIAAQRVAANWDKLESLCGKAASEIISVVADAGLKLQQPRVVDPDLWGPVDRVIVTLMGLLKDAKIEQPMFTFYEYLQQRSRRGMLLMIDFVVQEDTDAAYYLLTNRVSDSMFLLYNYANNAVDDPDAARKELIGRGLLKPKKA